MVKHVNKEVLLRFKEFTGVDLKTYLQVNINAACAADSIAILRAQLPASEAFLEENSLLPENLPADTHNRTEQKKSVARFWGIKEEELWRLWIDYDKQADNNPLIFDNDEPGYAAGMLNGWSFMTQGIAKPLTLASLIDLHDAAITYLSTEGTYGEYAAQTIGQISCP